MKYQVRKYYYVIFSIPYQYNRSEFEFKCPDSVTDKKGALRSFEQSSEFKIDGVVVHEIKTRDY